MSYYVYVLRSQMDGSLYKGMSNNVARREKEHNSGKNQSTKGKRPWKVVYIEKCLNREEAHKKEKYYKSGIGKEKINKIINN